MKPRITGSRFQAATSSWWGDPQNRCRYRQCSASIDAAGRKSAATRGGMSVDAGSDRMAGVFARLGGRMSAESVAQRPRQAEERKPEGMPQGVAPRANGAEGRAPIAREIRTDSNRCE